MNSRSSSDNHLPEVDRLLTIDEAAELIGLAKGTVYHLVSQRRIPVIRLSSRCIRFRPSDLYAWWDELTEKPSGSSLEKRENRSS